MKLRDIIIMANRNLLRSKLRTFLTILAVFIGSFTLTLTTGVGAGVNNYIDRQLGNAGTSDALYVQAKHRAVLGGGVEEYKAGGLQTDSTGIILSETDIQRIDQIPGVIAVEPFIILKADYAAGPNGKKFVFTISPTIRGLALDMATGRQPEYGARANEVALPVSFVEAMGFASQNGAIGKTIRIGISSPDRTQQEVEAVITGIQQKSLLGSGGATINKQLEDQLLSIQSAGLPANVTRRYVIVMARTNNASQDELQSIQTELDRRGYQGSTLDDQIGIAKGIISGIVGVLTLFAGIALLAASFGIINTLYMAVQERTKEIGLMKALGMSRRKVFWLFSLEAALIGFWGSLLGVAAGVAVGELANYFASQSFLKDLPGFRLLEFPPQTLALIMAAIMTVALVAGTLPARRASRKNPIDALRYE